MLALKHADDEKGAETQEEVCDFCGVPFANLDLSTSRRQRGKFCSQTCQRRAARRRMTARLAMPPSKRASKSLRFSDPLYFN
jgi:hypothetical protein